jgi:hypothetical protein
LIPWDGLPFRQVALIHKGNSITLDNVLIDTGLGGTVFKMDKVDELGVTIEKEEIMDEKEIDEVAKKVLSKHMKAFEELAK